MPYFNRFMKAAGILGIDIMKRGSKTVADMGGPGVVTGFIFGVFYYIAVDVFIKSSFEGIIFILASLNTILIITLIGIFDTLTALIKKREGTGFFEKYKRIGITWWLYFLIPLPAAVPLSAVKAGVSKMNIPFFGVVELGLLYPLVLIPVAVLCCSNATNFLAGLNGLEAGMGFVILSAMGIFAFTNGQMNAAVISLCFALSLLAFLRYNWYPAKVFPGDLNYTIGAVVASVTIIGNMEKFAILCFTPYILEAFIKASSKFEAESYGILKEDGVIKPRDGRVKSLTHLVMNLGSFTEWQVSLILVVFEAIICILAFLLIPYV
jgi:UDP-N-acetylglucosamine--dolichyl-phosphate N-acetylglucosaminephosphotransferase